MIVKKLDGERTNILGYNYVEMVCVPGDDDCFIGFIYGLIIIDVERFDAESRNSLI